MALEKFELGSLATIDEGRIAESFMQALRRCEADCKDRPTLRKDRKVTLEVTLVPVSDDRSELVEVLVQFEIKDAQPIRSSKVYHMNAGRGGLFYNDLSPEDARQLTLDGAQLQQLERKDVHVG
jgi:hypothetical protein